MKNEEMIGKKFGKLTILETFKDQKTRHTMCICRCECGKESIARKSNILSGKTSSCGNKISSQKYNYKTSRAYTELEDVCYEDVMIKTIIPILTTVQEEYTYVKSGRIVFLHFVNGLFRMGMKTHCQLTE